MTRTTRTETKKSAGSYALMAAILCALPGLQAHAQQPTPPPAVAEPPAPSPAPPLEPGRPAEPVPATQEGLDYLQSLPIIGNFFQTGKPQNDSVSELVQHANGDSSQTTALTQKMADRTRRIMVLRQLLTLGFTQADIQTALPQLHRLHDLKSPKPMDPEKAMDEEYQALLKASPKDPLPPNSALKIMDASRYYQEEQAKIWGEMAQRLGKTKSEGLSHLLRQDDNLLHYALRVANNSVRLPDMRYPAVAPRLFDPSRPATSVEKPKSAQAVPPVTENPGEARPVPASPATRAGGEDTHQPDQKSVSSVVTGKTTTGLNYATTGIILSSLTTHISLTDLIDLLQEKLKAMSDAPTKH